MTLATMMTLFFSMLILAATPGPGILLVSSKSITHGLIAGLLTSFGIILADIAYIIAVCYGLVYVSQYINSSVKIISVLGGCYLIYLGLKSIFKQPFSAYQPELEKKSSSPCSHLTAGFLVTISNPKAFLFYLSFLPAFINLHSISHYDVLIIIIIACFSIFPTMMTYSWLSFTAGKIGNSQNKNLLYKISGLVICSLGCYMLIRIFAD